MPSPNKKPSSSVTPVPGTIVWVRRRNGSWWPGRIISKKELLASNVMSPRSGTPVKLLGREDASVDWYNIEKSKRVKPFRCGEFDDCIRKAEAIVGMQSKRREKYARREDAIVDALELEKEQEDVLPQHFGAGQCLAAPPPISGKKTKPKTKTKVKNDAAAAAAAAAESKDPTYEQPVRKYTRKNKVKAVKNRDIAELGDSGTMLPRMRGLQDLATGTASRLSGGDGNHANLTTVDGSSEASHLDDPPVSPTGKAMKRKRSAGRTSGEDNPAKRREKRRPILQVMETVQRVDGNGHGSGDGDGEGDEPDATMTLQESDQTQPRMEPRMEPEEKLSDECESTQETISNTGLPNGSTAGHVMDAQSTSHSSRQTTTDSQPVTGDGVPQLSTLTSASAPLARKAPKVLKKGKMVMKPKVEHEEPSPRPEPNGKLPSPKPLKQPKQPKEEPDETVTGPSTKPDGQKAPPPKDGGTAAPHPKTRFEKQPVPMTSIQSALNKKAVYGYPVTVEVVRESSAARRKRAMARSQFGYGYSDSALPQPTSWQTAKRTARQRTPRSGITGYEDKPLGGATRRTAAGKEAMSKKVLKRAVMTSKKIRTLASISEEKRGTFKQPQLRMEAGVPRWPVATLVPVSVALNRLRAVVCS